MSAKVTVAPPSYSNVTTWQHRTTVAGLPQKLTADAFYVIINSLYHSGSKY